MRVGGIATPTMGGFGGGICLSMGSIDCIGHGLFEGH